MRVAIAGGGNVGTYIASELSSAGHQVVVIESDPGRCETASAQQPLVTWHCADACEVAGLASADVASVDVMVAVTGDDEDNLVISLLSKQEFAVPRVIARINNPDNEWLFNESWGVDMYVSTPHLLTAMVEEAVSVGSLVRLLSFAGGQARLAEVTLAPDSPAIGKEIMQLGMPRDSIVVAVVRNDHLIVPRGDTVLFEGDEVLVLETAESEDAVARLLIAD